MQILMLLFVPMSEHASIWNRDGLRYAVQSGMGKRFGVDEEYEENKWRSRAVDAGVLLCR
ncbi:hypothetical protein SY83_07865 [Paenibacillus swuensis]|uniref:Uncharacterized protein n=1 Tax=Paenibacillus swuensis TaxID=1178515 RepID=A0A172TGN5_9BACL|nr:hypothetical protein [Paenibacillus swuensis]ANE46201.1 hypothetical protein SY83_07865 [Paenibacillus swuensis]